MNTCIKCEVEVDQKETRLINFQDDYRRILSDEEYKLYPREHINCGGKIVVNDNN